MKPQEFLQERFARVSVVRDSMASTTGLRRQHRQVDKTPFLTWKQKPTGADQAKALAQFHRLAGQGRTAA